MQDKGDLDAAIKAYKKALQIDGDYAEAHNNSGNALVEKGNLPQVVASYRRALQIRPDYAEAHSHLAHAQKYHGLEQHLKQMLDLYDRKDLSQSDRMHLSFALVKVHDDILDFDPAFGFFHQEIALENRCSGITLKRIADCFQFSRISLQRAVVPILSRLGLSGKPTNCPFLFWGCRAPGQHW